jgi:hypothetical protein
MEEAKVLYLQLGLLHPVPPRALGWLGLLANLLLVQRMTYCSCSQSHNQIAL